LGDRKGFWPVITSASKRLGMAVNMRLVGYSQNYRSILWAKWVLVCPVKPLSWYWTGHSVGYWQQAELHTEIMQVEQWWWWWRCSG